MDKLAETQLVEDRVEEVEEDGHPEGETDCEAIEFVGDAEPKGETVATEGEAVKEAMELEADAVGVWEVERQFEVVGVTRVEAETFGEFEEETLTVDVFELVEEALGQGETLVDTLTAGERELETDTVEVLLEVPVWEGDPVDVPDTVSEAEGEGEEELDGKEEREVLGDWVLEGVTEGLLVMDPEVVSD